MSIEGVLVSDLFTLNSLLGATIEDQAVAILNSLRSIWDPRGELGAYSFVRQPQTFPDVRLQSRLNDGSTDILLGIELKGWYVLAKEAEPSFRMKQSPSACAAHDLICVVPWALRGVISGTPITFEPFIEQAKFAAELRNWHWNQTHPPSNQVKECEGANPYPVKRDQLIDSVPHDGGGNFGRLARAADLMGEFKDRVGSAEIAGIAVSHWRRFFKAFTEQAEDRALQEKIEGAVRMIEQDLQQGAAGEVSQLRRAVQSLADALEALETDSADQ